MPASWDSNRNAEIARRYQAGETLRQVGAHYNLSAERVRQILNRLGVPTRSAGEAKRGTTKVTPEQQAEIIRRRERNESVSVIAAALGLGGYAVSRALRRAGYDTTNPGYINRPGQPRVCTTCLRTEREGARFRTTARNRSRKSSRCMDCTAANTRAYYWRNAERINAAAREKRRKAHV